MSITSYKRSFFGRFNGIFNPDICIKMKQPTLSQFKATLKDLIDDISVGKLKKIIDSVAEETRTENRLDFLIMVEQIISGNCKTPGEKTIPVLTPEALFEKIESYVKRMENGEFFDEERDYEEYHRNEYRHYRNNYDYYEEDTDFSTEEYVLEMEDLLEKTQSFYSHDDIDTAKKSYQSIFSIIDDEIYEYEEYFIHGFSFKEALGESFYNSHKIQFLRTFYLSNIESDQTAIFNLFIKQRSIYLSNIVDAENKQLKGIDGFTDAYISHLSNQPEHARHLVDALFVNGGIEELRCFAYKKANKIPAVFLAFFSEQKERDTKSDELLKIALDGIQLIPEKFASRSILSNDIILIAQKEGDKELLLTGYSSAFYSNPTIANLDAYLGYIAQHSIRDELDRLELFLAGRKDVMKNKEGYFSSHSSIDAFSTASSDISKTGYIISHYIFFGLNGLLSYNDGSILGFQNEKKYIPAIMSLLFVSVSPLGKVVIIEMLLDKYCFDNDFEASKNLKQLIYNKASQNAIVNVNITEELKRSENIAVNRVRHILKNKLRGGYESSCLLLVACAEAKESVDHTGNRIIREIDTEYKRFTAFRRELKALTQKSRLLITVK